MYHDIRRGGRPCALRLLLMSKNVDAFSRLSAVLGAESRVLLQQLLLIRQICLCALYVRRYGTDADAAVGREADRGTDADAGADVGREADRGTDADADAYVDVGREADRAVGSGSGRAAAAGSGAGLGAGALVLWSAPACERGSLAAEVVEYCGVAEFVQRDGHLGERMERALVAPGDELGVENQLLLGIDSLGLGVSRLHDCVEALLRKPWVFVPAADGGFVACGVNLNARGGYAPTSPAVAFAQRRWSHAGVLADVLARLDPREYECTQSAGDIDSVADLAQARADGSLALALDAATRCLTAARAGIAPADFLDSLVLEEPGEIDAAVVEQRLHISSHKLANDPRLNALTTLLLQR